MQTLQIVDYNAAYSLATAVYGQAVFEYALLVERRRDDDELRRWIMASSSSGDGARIVKRIKRSPNSRAAIIAAWYAYLNSRRVVPPQSIARPRPPRYCACGEPIHHRSCSCRKCAARERWQKKARGS